MDLRYVPAFMTGANNSSRHLKKDIIIHERSFAIARTDNSIMSLKQSV